MKSESRIQQNIFEWYQNNFCLEHHDPREIILHIPNEKQYKLIGIGLYPGAADLLVSIDRKLHFFEVKAETGSQSPSQKKFEKHCKQVGIPYFLVRSLNEFKELVYVLNYEKDS